MGQSLALASWYTNSSRFNTKYSNIGIREMESFELGKEIEKDIFASCHERGMKEKFWVPMRNRISDLQIPRFVALLLSHGDYGERLYGPYEIYYDIMTSVLYTTRISNVDSSIFVNIIREMVSVELGKEIEKDVFASCHERGTRKKFWVPMRNRSSDTSHMNFVKELIGTFSLSHARDKTKNTFFYSNILQTFSVGY